MLRRPLESVLAAAIAVMDKAAAVVGTPIMESLLQGIENEASSAVLFARQPTIRRA